MTSLSDRGFIGAVKDEWQLYSDNAQDYTIGPAIGYGASSIVYSATFHPKGSTDPPVPCAVKILDLDKLPPHALHLLRRETQLMSLSKHPNVLRVRGSWTDGHHLCIALRLMNAGSAADVMRYAWPGGFEEEIVKCILKQALEGLNYLHINGFIHRDVKAANMLIDDDGTVLMADLGVAADLLDDHPTPNGRDADNHHRKAVSFEPGVTARTLSTTGVSPVRPVIMKRKSFVGTPAWMAPEVIKGKQYDASADIWSFGITAIELTQGRAPRSRETLQKVLLRTVQDAPPEFSRVGGDGQNKYSRALAEMAASCLAKDPASRPTAAQLLQLPLFKNTKKKQYLVNTILQNLPPLQQRQERRRIPQHSTRTSIESWDFNTLSHPASPILTRHSRPGGSPMVDISELGKYLPSRSSSEHELAMPHGGSSINGSHSNLAKSITRTPRSRYEGSSRAHSRSVSWMEDERDIPLIFPVDVTPEEKNEDPIADAPDVAKDTMLAEKKQSPVTDEEGLVEAEEKTSFPKEGRLAPLRGLAAPMTIPELSVSPTSPTVSPLPTPSTTPNFDEGKQVVLPSTSAGDEAAFATIKPRLNRSGTVPSPMAPQSEPQPVSSTNSPSLWQKLRRKERQMSASEDKEARRSMLGGLLTRIPSGGSPATGSMRAKFLRSTTERK